MSLYEDLGVGPDATPEAINAAFRRAAKKHHPDAGGDAEAFGRVQRAALILRDPAKRARYDADGTVDDGPSEQPDPALAILASAFASIFAEIEDLAAVNLVDRLQSKLRKERAEADMALRMTDDDLNRVADALKRLKYKGGGQIRRPCSHAGTTSLRPRRSEAAADRAPGGDRHGAGDGGRLHLARRSRTRAATPRRRHLDRNRAPAPKTIQPQAKVPAR